MTPFTSISLLQYFSLKCLIMVKGQKTRYHCCSQPLKEEIGHIYSEICREGLSLEDAGKQHTSFESMWGQNDSTIYM